eukprot:IDg15501t1
MRDVEGGALGLCSLSVEKFELLGARSANCTRPHAHAHLHALSINTVLIRHDTAVGGDATPAAARVLAPTAARALAPTATPRFGRGSAVSRGSASLVGASLPGASLVGASLVGAPLALSLACVLALRTRAAEPADPADDGVREVATKARLGLVPGGVGVGVRA